MNMKVQNYLMILNVHSVDILKKILNQSMNQSCSESAEKTIKNESIY